jgi:hypothetical protein
MAHKQMNTLTRLSSAALTLTALLSALSGAPSQALADPLMIAGSEEGRPEVALKTFGFIQPRAEYYLGGAVEGLEAGLANFNGDTPSFNRTGQASFDTSIARARFGLRGAIPDTNKQVTYFMLFEAGQVPITRVHRVAPVDLSVTLSYLPGARLRLGSFKLPVMEEITLPVPSALEFIQFSTTLARLLNENPIEGGALTGGGSFTGGASAFRDLGAQVFDSFERGAWRLSYALMSSSGTPELKAQRDGRDLTARLEVAHHTGGKATQLRRPELKLVLWRQQGHRFLDVEVEGTPKRQSFERVRQGAALRLERQHYWGMIEVAQGRGALEVGTHHPFVGGRPSITPQGEAWGAVAQGGVRFFGAPINAKEGAPRAEVGVKARLEQYHQNTQDEVLLRVFTTLTLGAEWRPVPRFRVELNYELRRLEAGDQAPQNAQRIAEAMGDRVLTQATLMF